VLGVLFLAGDGAVGTTFKSTGTDGRVEVDPTALRRWSHWTPPPLQDKRFSPAFFVAPAVAADVRVTIDDGEIRAHRVRRALYCI